MQATERLKPGGARKKLLSETQDVKEGEIKMQKGQRVFIELEVVEKQEDLTSLASIDFHDLVEGKSISGVFKVNSLTFAP